MTSLVPIVILPITLDEIPKLRTKGQPAYQLRMTLTTFGSWVGYDLPVPVKRLAFGQGCNHNCQKGYSEEPTYELETNFVRPLPYLTCQPLEKFGHSKFSYPKTAAMLAFA